MRGVIVSGVALLAVALAIGLGMRSCGTGAPPTAMSEPAVPAAMSPVATVSSPAAPASASSEPSPAASPLTDDRRLIYDSPDIMTTIRRLRVDGTADEKKWALELLVSCVLVNAHARDAAVRDAAASAPDPSASAAAPTALAIRQRQALDDLVPRCSGVKDLPLADRQSMKDELRAAFCGNRSVLARLDALSSTQEDRWSSEEAQLITASLHGGDPVLARAAFYALVGAMDRDAPGGLDRFLAMTRALGPIFTDVPLSNFERLDACVAVGLCGSDWSNVEAGTPVNAEILRLAAKYRAAVDAHLDARSIMAIR